MTKKDLRDTARPGNRAGFSVDQHVFPESAIKRFGSGPEFKVHVQRLIAKSAKHYAPGADMFCATRAWDETTEKERSRKVEGEYKALADQVASRAVQSLTAEQDRVATEFYALWKARHLARTKPLGALAVPNVTAEPQLSWDARENLEKNRYLYANEGAIPSHMAGAIQVFASRLHTRRAMKDCHWGIVTAASGEFLVPDDCADLGVIPVAPTTCLAVNAPDCLVDLAEVARVNGLLRGVVHAYYFARDLRACPLPPR